MGQENNKLEPPDSVASIARNSLNAAWEDIGCSVKAAGQQPQSGQDNSQQNVVKEKGEAHPNYTAAAVLLQQAEEAYQKNDYGRSLNFAVQGHDAAVKARLAESPGSRLLSIVVFVVLTFYFVWALSTLVYIDTRCPPTGTLEPTASASGTSTETSEPTATPEPTASASSTSTETSKPTATPEPMASPSSTLTATSEPTAGSIPSLWAKILDAACESEKGTKRSLSIPVLFWGFLGGVVWCMQGLYRWYSHRLFDHHYVYWYFLNPWVAAVLGGMFVLAVLSGLFSVNEGADLNSSKYFLYLTSFVVGLATHDFLKLLIRIVSTLFGQVATGDETKEASV